MVTGSGGNPFLQMAIRDGHGINGDIVQAAQVGQRLTLDVVMRDTSEKTLLNFRRFINITDKIVELSLIHQNALAMSIIQ